MDQLLFRRLTAGFAPTRLLRRVLAPVHRALERAQQRRALSGLSEAMLQDIGLTRGDAERESEKPFWR